MGLPPDSDHIRFMELGSIILWKNIQTFGSGLQRWWSNTIYSHSGLYAGSMWGLEFEADLKVRFHRYEESYKKKCDIFEIQAPSEVREEVLEKIVDIYEGDIYGFISWLTIFIRYLFERLGFDAKDWNILWGWGVTCSELVWYYLMRIAEACKWEDFRAELMGYNPNLFTPKDIRILIDKYPAYFKAIK